MKSDTDLMSVGGMLSVVGMAVDGIGWSGDIYVGCLDNISY